MSLIREIFNNIILKSYLYFIGEEKITKHIGECIEVTTNINGIIYTCFCRENVFRIVPKNKFAKTRVNRTYLVSVTANDSSESTSGVYPLMCPNKFIYTNYPLMLAIRCHYNIHYK